MAKCPVCGKGFNLNRPWQLYCSGSCSQRAKDARLALRFQEKVRYYERRYGEKPPPDGYQPKQ